MKIGEACLGGRVWEDKQDFKMGRGNASEKCASAYTSTRRRA